MPATIHRRAITARQLEIVRPYLEGATSHETAQSVGVAHETVRKTLANIRRELRHEGYAQIHTSIGLRKALRARGDIDKLEQI